MNIGFDNKRVGSNRGRRLRGDGMSGGNDGLVHRFDGAGLQLAKRVANSSECKAF